MRIQIIMALVATLVLVAVPLYLWRRPQPESIPSADAAVADAGAPRLPTSPFPQPFLLDGGVASMQPSGPNALVPPGTPMPEAGPRLEIAPIKTLKCQDPGAGRTPPERCDGLRAFEDALSRAIRDSQSCAPSQKSSFVMSYVLEMNFPKKHTSLFLGKSTTLARTKRKDLLKCVERAMPAPDWDRIPHQHSKYTINAVVTYPPVAAPVAAEMDAPGGNAPSGNAPSGNAPSGNAPGGRSGSSAPKKARPSGSRGK